MRWLFCAAIVVALPSPAAAELRGVRVLSNPRARDREPVLVDALKIYTRDLGRPVRLAGTAPATLETAELERVAEDARRDGDEIVVWLGERNGAPVLLALRVATFELRETAVEPDDPSRTARTLALKVRALLAARTDDPSWSVPPEAPPPTTPAPAPTTAPVTPAAPTPTPPEQGPDLIEPTTLPPPAPAPAPAATVRSNPAPTGPRRVWLDATVAYGVTVPTQTDWVRHGLTVRFAVPWGRLPLSAFVDAAFTTAPTATVDGTPISARVWPVGAGIAFRLHRPRWQLDVGPRASLQIVDADARSAAGRIGTARRYAAGLGVLGEVAWLFSRYVGAAASVSAEALVPRLQFAAGGPSTTDLGYFQFGVTLGLIVSVP